MCYFLSSVKRDKHCKQCKHCLVHSAVQPPSLMVFFILFCYLGKSCMLSWRQQGSMHNWVSLSNGINLF